MYLQGFRYKPADPSTAIQRSSTPGHPKREATKPPRPHFTSPFLLPVSPAKDLLESLGTWASCAPPPPTCLSEKLLFFFLFLSPCPNRHRTTESTTSPRDLTNFWRTANKGERRRTCVLSPHSFFLLSSFLGAFFLFACSATSSYIYLT